MANNKSPKINLHIVIPQEMYDKLKREGLLDKDRIANVDNVWFTKTSLDRIHVTVALSDSTPYTHVASATKYREDTINLDLRTSPM